MTTLRYGLLPAVLILSLAGLDAGAAKGDSVVSLQARPFDLTEVRLLDSPFLAARERTRQYLHELDADRLLHTFRLNAGLPTSAKPYGGWEEPKCEVRGHTLGHYLSACALMYAGTGDGELKNKADYLVKELAKIQEKLGGSGYLSAFPESFIDRVEEGKPVWAPYYTLHKILNGLVDVHEHCGNPQALEVAEAMAGWVKTRCDRLGEEKMQRMLAGNEQGGMNDALARLYTFTGNPDHLTLARRFDEKAYNDSLAKRIDHLKGFHSNSFIPTVIGTALEYELTGEKSYKTIAEFFWDQVADHRSFATGGTSNYEFWRTDPDVLASELSPESQETCCQYNMLKLTRSLFGWSADPERADYYERALYNSILSTQDPESGMAMYYVPLNSGQFKVFHTPEDSFWCCTGTGMENHAKYNDSIYFHGDESLYVNLFIPSELNWKEKGFRLRQETRFPEEEGTTLTVETDRPANMSIRIRIPYWATRGAAVTVNGENTNAQAVPSTYVELKRTWKTGDQINVSLPMSLHTQPLPDDPDRVAVMYGPLVLAAELGTEKLTKEMQIIKDQREQENAPAIEIPRLPVESRDPSEWLKPVPNRPLAFQTANAGLDRELTFVPFHTLFHQRYAVYWPLHSKEEWKAIDEAQAKRAAMQSALEQSLEARTLDRVRIGDAGSEQEHRLDSKNSRAGTHQDKAWRDAAGNGWFSYDLKVLPDHPMTLRCLYWGDDADRVFEIRIDGKKFMKEILDRNAPGTFLVREYPIPFDLSAGKDKVTVSFHGLNGKIAGGIFDCRMMKLP